MSIQESYKTVVSRIQSAARGRPVELVAVSKGQSPEAVLELYQCGHKDFGENYVQEFLEKKEWLSQHGAPDIRWHFIGALQKNKIKKIVPHVWTIHSVDSTELAKKISSEAQNSVKIFLQINIDAEPTKAGVSPDGTASMLREISTLKNISLEGLMCIPSPEENPESAFKKMTELSRATAMYHGRKLSMGMSGDFETAIECGATSVRVGTLLFGERRRG